MISLVTVSNDAYTSDLLLINDSMTLCRERTIGKVRMVARVCASRERASSERAKASRDPATLQRCLSQCMLNARESVEIVHTFHPTFCCVEPT